MDPGLREDDKKSPISRNYFCWNTRFLDKSSTEPSINAKFRYLILNINGGSFFLSNLLFSRNSGIFSPIISSRPKPDLKY